ncbi:MAG: TIGR00730 family Rossman fold protein [Pseudobdellovibrionaceae bacterium]|nr:MAG: TIGR00730 family Rossman fold protein [Pseudobdellovibrionaceae bacterium]
MAPMYFSEAERLAESLARGQHELVYGGSKLGLMGHLADKTLEYGGRVTGVIPEYLDSRPGMAHAGLTEKIIVNNLMDRKREMIARADVIVAFPGGIGTMDEVFEAMALKQLNEINHPVIFLNFLDFWRPLLDYFEELTAQNMINQPLDQLFQVLDDSAKVVDYLDKWQL